MINITTERKPLVFVRTTKNPGNHIKAPTLYPRAMLYERIANKG